MFTRADECDRTLGSSHPACVSVSVSVCVCVCVCVREREEIGGGGGGVRVYKTINGTTLQ
jgi:DNA integrity scanning protein DisA with diadenylate cyclase activity